MRLQEITLRTVRLPLIRPYVLSYRTFTEFEPIIVQIRGSDGRIISRLGTSPLNTAVCGMNRTYSPFLWQRSTIGSTQRI